jgi:enoyl-CoA hydratase
MSTDLASFDTLVCEGVAPHVLRVTLNRPAVGNAINTQMGRDLLRLWTQLTEDPGEWRCVVLSGAGEKIFCAGGDLKERNGMSRAQWQQQHEIFERQSWAMVDMPLPIVGALNGHAYGGGLELALCCDFIYAADTVRMALPEVGLGIMPGMGGTQNLPRAVGERRAREIILTGRPFSAQQGLEWGLVNQVCALSALPHEALETAKRIAANAPLAVRQVKKSIRYGGQMELRTAYRFEVEAYNHLVDTEDRREGVAAFNEKRPPVFHGR